MLMTTMPIQTPRKMRVNQPPPSAAPKAVNMTARKMVAKPAMKMKTGSTTPAQAISPSMTKETRMLMPTWP